MNVILILPNKSEGERKEIFETTMRDVLDSHLNIETMTLPPSEESSNEQPSPNIISACNEDEEQHAPCNKTSNGSVLAYANEVFH